MEALGVRSCADLRRVPRAQLLQRFGERVGSFLHAACLGKVGAVAGCEQEASDVGVGPAHLDQRQDPGLPWPRWQRRGVAGGPLEPSPFLLCLLSPGPQPVAERGPPKSASQSLPVPPTYPST